MVLHSALVQQNTVDEKITLINRPARSGKCRAGDREFCFERVHQCLGHRADIAARRRVEGRTVFEVVLDTTGHLQPSERRERLLHRVVDGDGARLQCNHHRIGVRRPRTFGHADHLHGPHAVIDENARQIGATGQVVGNATQKCGHQCSVMTQCAPSVSYACRLVVASIQVLHTLLG